jgi:hypothetical protein
MSNCWNIPKHFITSCTLSIVKSQMSTVKSQESRAKRNSRSGPVDHMLLTTIKKAPGLSLYELGQVMKWSNGKVDGSLRRLLSERKIVISAIERNGRPVHLVYPKYRLHYNTVEIPKSLLKSGNPTWKDVAFFYALDNLSFGITGKRFLDWERVSSFREKVKLLNKKDRLVVTIPEKFANFYRLSEKRLTKSIADNNVLLTINGTIIESMAYPAK